MEMCECFAELIEQHNDQLDTMYGLANVLMETYPDVEDTYVNDAFCDAMNCVIEQGVHLCVMANCSVGNKWYMDDDGFVFAHGLEIEECECCGECSPKISNYLS